MSPGDGGPAGSSSDTRGKLTDCPEACLCGFGAWASSGLAMAHRWVRVLAWDLTSKICGVHVRAGLPSWTAGPDAYGGYDNPLGPSEDIWYNSRGKRTEQIGQLTQPNVDSNIWVNGD